MTLTEFLLARFAEDEAAARAAAGGRWVAITDENRRRFTDVGDVYLVADRDGATPNAWIAGVHGCGPDVSREQVGEHIARHDPARVLAECAAKRWMVEQAQGVFDAFRADPGLSELHWNYTALLSRFALPYADHPDYDEAWRP